MKKVYTFRDVKKFLENAEVDNFGFHDLSATEGYPKQILQIYTSKRECNFINRQSDDTRFETCLGKLYFREEEVCMIQVDKNWVADYDNQYVISIDTEINNSLMHECVKAFEHHGRIMYRLIKYIIWREDVKSKLSEIK